MEPHDILALYDRQQRIEIEFPGMHKETTPHVVRFVRPGSGMNFVLFSRLNEENVEAVIQNQVAFFRQWDQPFSWKVYDHDTPRDLGERLIRHGFVRQEREAIMVLDLGNVPPSLLEPVESDIRKIVSREKLQDVIRVEEQVWGREFDWIIERMGDYLELPGYLSVYVAYADNKPVCTGWTYFYEDSMFAGLWGGSTVAAYRGQGLYSAILAVRVQEAVRRGYRFLTIDASPMSQPIVSKRGFELLTYARDYEWKRD
jgi:GNAT superfamily N-acetyltransferase